jgi:hypothetical protein
MNRWKCPERNPVIPGQDSRLGTLLEREGRSSTQGLAKERRRVARQQFSFAYPPGAALSLVAEGAVGFPSRSCILHG